ncbi:hypothetical protein [Methylobacterium nodulans]|uniref:Uncharacterized protein n=1 Tax=Methylobacterium nodulans (strain LMG 21967 / CNCM I-2342 / ORS 2060) TaxID=460265 RepID=B8IAN1_METNO|nr:hypothetical protein [Methylobacterium nodulans]ACL61076.1 hypothetical protein Mnod_6271 [Methylobacterium nodulans ORS 2060]
MSAARRFGAAAAAIAWRSDGASRAAAEAAADLLTGMAAGRAWARWQRSPSDFPPARGWTMRPRWRGPGTGFWPPGLAARGSSQIADASAAGAAWARWLAQVASPAFTTTTRRAQ